MPAAVRLGNGWRIIYSNGGTAAIWKRPIRHHQPSEPAALRLLEASEAAGLHNYVIV